MKIEAHTHAKMRRLSNALRPLVADPGIDPQTIATGMLERLWCWTASNHRSGVLHGVDDEVLATEIGWYKDPATLVNALVHCRWLDRNAEGVLAVHDWRDHCPEWVKGALSWQQCPSCNNKFRGHCRICLPHAGAEHGAKQFVKHGAEKLAQHGPGHGAQHGSNKNGAAPQDGELAQQGAKLDAEHGTQHGTQEIAQHGATRGRGNPRPKTQDLEAKAPLSSPSATTQAKVTGSEAFSQFWSSYPATGRQRSGRAEAWKAWLKSGAAENPELAMQALKAAKESRQWQQQAGEFVPGTHSWLTRGSWQEVITAEPNISQIQHASNLDADGIDYAALPDNAVKIRRAHK